MSPAAGVGFYFAHPESRYFGVAEIGRDQVKDYAGRKGMTQEEAEKWLGACLRPRAVRGRAALPLPSEAGTVRKPGRREVPSRGALELS